ncbi:MAG: hypothetical protein JW963_14970 [Anaerolineales bacterium]|nr:hypothetical protein [Anaerolineales bacterium]
MPKLRFPAKTIPVAFFILTILTYGLMLPWTGFYWDDWPFAWIANFLGSSEFIPAFEPFRPFLGPIFFGTTSLLPPNPLLWQSLALFLRFALAWAIWWMFRTIWPKAKWQTLTAALFFLVFPGYSQHWVAFTHINQEWIPFLFYLLSFGFTARAFRTPEKSRWFTGLALLFLLLGVFPTEYFATQEPLRFLFLWALVAEGTAGFWPRTRRILKIWWPYLLIWSGNAAWLMYYYKFGAYASYGVSVAGGLSLPDFILVMADALWKAGIYSWGQVLILAVRSLSNPSTLLTLGMIAVGFVVVAFYLRQLDIPGDGKSSYWGWQAVTFGLIGILIGRIPSWAAGLPLTLQSINDRFMVSMMIGGSLFLAGLLELFFGKGRIKIYAVALVIALGIGQQFYIANDFRRDWTRQQEIFWQMAWRMPGLEPGTVILTHELPLGYETDMGLTAPLNWVYAPDYAGGDLSYALLYTRTRLDGVSLPALDPGQTISFEYRTVDFEGSTSQAVTIIVPPNACLRVLDSVYAGGDTYERQPRFLRDAIPLSDPSLIITDVKSPNLPTALFGQEPPHTWCYYYAKAELARQIGDWERVVVLGNEAREQGFVPGDALEWLPFIEAYVLTGDYQIARELSILAYNDDSRPRKGLCHTWQRIRADGQGQVEQLASEILEKFECVP